MHLGILTGGGDVPGLNPAIKTVVNEADRRGWRVTGFRRGWAGKGQRKGGRDDQSVHFPAPEGRHFDCPADNARGRVAIQ